MTGVLDGITVLDLSQGIAGPMAGMLLRDHGASVTRVEVGEDPFAGLAAYRVWNRGKRSALFDAADPADAGRLRRLAERADIVIESFGPGGAERLGLGHDELAAVNPGLIYCSLSAYGDLPGHAGRPGYDALVAARTGHNYEGIGTMGGTVGRLSGSGPMVPDFAGDPDWLVGPHRDGPAFEPIPWISLACGYLATLGINAALRVRGLTGRGQRVSTSLLQGALATTIMAWQRVENPNAEGYLTWIMDKRAPKGFFKCSDGKWMHQWVALPEFFITDEQGDGPLSAKGRKSPRQATMRFSTEASEMVLLTYYAPQLTEIAARYPLEDWVRVGAEVGIPLQPVRSPEEALLDPALQADGCVAEVDDPDYGRILEVGRTYSLSLCPDDPPAAVHVRGADTEAVRAEADAPAGSRPSTPVADGQAGAAQLDAPLAGITVLDLGVAVAGPFGTQLLADLGADVIKVNNMTGDPFWMRSGIAMTANRNKRSIALDLKSAEGMAVLRDLVARADIVQHNMRYPAAVRLGVDYESLRQLKPDLIYCHTRGFEQGARELLPGNDQTGAALAGTSYLDGGTGDGGRPLWSNTSLGDTGNGFLSAIGMIQALYHRERTGEGQFVDTSIIYAQLLNACSWVTPDGQVSADRPDMDKNMEGVSALHRIYRCADGRWLALAAFTYPQFEALAAVLGYPALASHERFATSGRKGPDDAALTEQIAAILATRPGPEWFATLDAAGVPVELADPDFVLGVFDDPELVSRGWVTTVKHPVVGSMDLCGKLIDFSETPGRIVSGPLVPGQHTQAILARLGYDDERIAKLIETGVARQWTQA
jgi:crotonobetainyl-CoA:carnitine CoA-transferase CaiB-like acyl-CoA transferase